MTQNLIDDATFNYLWNGDDELGLFDFALPDNSPKLCPPAQSYAEWADALCQQVGEEPTIVGVNQAMLFLTKQYFEWFSIVQKRHKYRIGENGHTCIFQVFVQTYEQLKAMELGLLPPFISTSQLSPLPPQSPAPQTPRIAGLIVAEEGSRND